MNRGRHKKKKIIQKITYEDLIAHLKRITNNSFYGVNNNTQYHFNPYFSINEQGTTSKTKRTSKM
jgi:hypothetical protein